VPVLPDYIINVGGAAVTGLLLTGIAPACRDVRDLVGWLYDQIGERIRENVSSLLAHVDSATPLGEIGMAFGGRPQTPATPSAEAGVAATAAVSP